MGSKANQVFISLGLVGPPLRPLTLREARVNGLSVICQSVSGSRLANRSRSPIGVPCQGLLFALVRCLVLAGGTITMWLRG